MRWRFDAAVAGARAERGFTLIETLIVLTLLAFIAAAVPAIMTGLSGVRLRAAADDMAGHMRETRRMAVRSGLTTSMVLDPVRGVVATSTDPGPTAWPGVLEQIEIMPRSLVGPDRTARIDFFADGTATLARLLLRGGRRSTVITVDPLTGVVARE